MKDKINSINFETNYDIVCNVTSKSWKNNPDNIKRLLFEQICSISAEREYN